MKYETTRVFCQSGNFLWTSDIRFCYKNVTFEQYSTGKLQMEKEEQKAFKNISYELCAKSLGQPYRLTKEATMAIGLFSGTSSYDLCLKEVVTSRTKLFKC